MKSLPDEKKQECLERLWRSRERILCKNGFFGLLLMKLGLDVDLETPTAYTDARKIVFGVDFLDTLTEKDVDIVMMHEILHVVMGHCFRGKAYDDKDFNIACDIVVNSNIFFMNHYDKKSITVTGIGEIMHETPYNVEGYFHTAEEVCEQIKKNDIYMRPSRRWQRRQKKIDKQCWDDHAKWKEAASSGMLSYEWDENICEVASIIMRGEGKTGGTCIPSFVLRRINELMNPQIHWRTVLNEFVQTNVCDYSLFPPDKRYGDSDFFIPDLNDKDELLDRVLFIVDTSASISDKMLTAAFSEIKGAIDQFDGKIEGWISFFDTTSTKPVPFSSIRELLQAKPRGGGGTDFKAAFEALDKMSESPAEIVILTDGEADFPTSEVARGIPVLWVINNDKITPTWGKLARISID